MWYCDRCMHDVPAPAPVLVLLNEQHTLTDSQQAVLFASFGDAWKIEPVPASGWTAEQMRGISAGFMGNVVFASPVPYLMALMANRWDNTYLFHNDKREKKELPNGAIIMVVAKEGWQLLEI